MKSRTNAVLPLLVDYTRLQRDLCIEFLRRHANVKSDAAIAAVQPRVGTVRLNEADWRFLQHGMGIRFERASDGAIVEAHVAPVSMPEALDAYRVQAYCESVGVDQLEHLGRTYEVNRENVLQELLNDLALDGKLRLLERQKLLYKLAP